jgi:hypothetical protein
MIFVLENKSALKAPRKNVVNARPLSAIGATCAPAADSACSDETEICAIEFPPLTI